MKRIKCGVLALMVALLPSEASSQVMIDFQPGMRLGVGYDAVTGEIKTKCMTGMEPAPVPLNQTVFSWDEAATTNDLRKSLQIDAAVAYKALSGNGASGKASVLNSSFSSRSVVSIVAKNRIATSTSDLVSPVVMKTGADALAFRRRCGTHFLSSLISGGELYAVLSQTITSEKEKEEFSAAAQASYAGLQADLSSKTELEKSRFAKSIRIQGSISGGDNNIFMTPEELRNTFIAFRDKVNSGGSVPIEAVFTAYSGLTDIDQDKIEAVGEALVKLSSIRDFRGELAAIQLHPEFYFVDPKSVATVAPVVDKLATDLDRDLRKQMQRCASKTGDLKENCHFSSIPVAPIGSANGLPALFKAGCISPFLPPEYGAEFASIPRVRGDEATGGNDVVRITTAFSGQKGGSLNQVTTVVVEETSTGDTRYEATLGRKLLDVSQGDGCGLTGDVAIPQNTGSFALGSSENDFRNLEFNTLLIESAECRSNKPGEDDGYAGCRAIKFKPIPLQMEHAERIVSTSTPLMNVPDWLKGGVRP